MMRRLGRWIGVGALALLVWGGCDSSSFDNESEGQLRDFARQQRALWQEEGIDAYRMTYQRTCACPPEVAGPFDVFVRSNVRDSVLFNGQPVAPPLDAYFTVESLFDFIEQGLNAGPDRVSLRFDELLGFPTFVFFDYDATRGGEEDAITVTDVVELADGHPAR